MVKLSKGQGQAKGDLLDIDTVPRLTKTIGKKSAHPSAYCFVDTGLLTCLYKHAPWARVVSDPEKTWNSNKNQFSG